MNIALISCTKLKQTYPCKAKEMYLPSTLFKYASNHILKSNYDQWFILSAKYGLLNPEDEIEPYNLTLNSMNKRDRIIWSTQVFKILINNKIKKIDFYAGLKYREFLIPMCEKEGIDCKIPLVGLGIGQQLKYYKERFI